MQTTPEQNYDWAARITRQKNVVQEQDYADKS